MDQLFLIEILVDTIFFSSPDAVPPKKQINIVATFGNFASLEIRNDGLGGVEENTKSADLDFCSGKSYLFPCNADTLLEALKQSPLELSVGTKISSVPIGKVTYHWVDDFIDMVTYCKDSYGYITPVSHRDVYPMKDNAGNETGHVEVFVRLSCFGKNIQTQFQVVHTKDAKDGTPKTQFLFKSNNAATTFQCQRFGLGSSADAIPVAPMYNTLDLEDKGLKPVYTFRDSCQFQEPSTFNLEQTLERMTGRSMTDDRRSMMDDQMSLMERLEDNKFFDLEQFKMMMMSGSFFPGSRTFEQSIHSYTDEDLTAENISKFLCKHKDCPAAKKFKELGIGPLATGSGLGTVYGEVDPPVLYGLSHANGTMEHYGPYGFYRRAKRPDQPFEPKRSKSSLSSRSKKSSSCSCDKVLRLSGGAPMDDKANISPVHACKDLMDDFDKLVDAYKKALGPCGQATCPYAQNLIIETCQKYCPMKVAMHNLDQTPEICPPQSPEEQFSGIPNPILQMPVPKPPDANSFSSCGMQNCPYAREMYQPVEEEMKKSQPVPACGNASCPYTKQLLGITDEDTDEAVKLLASDPQGCVPPAELPPIHWDCPDPLPRGRCISANCPINKIQDMVKRMFEPKSVCGGPQCPYAIPPPCRYPTCPFAMTPPCMLPCDTEICTDPNCPVNKLSSGSVCKDPNCPFSQKPEECKMNEGSICDDPECPYKQETGAGDATAEKAEEAGSLPTEYLSGDNLEPCTPNTCKARGGDLECDVCPCAGGSRLEESSGTQQQQQHQQEKKRDKSGKKMKGTSQSAPVISKKSTKSSVPRQNTPTVSEKRIPQSSSTSESGCKHKRKRRSRFVYDTGDIYPGVKVGHRECIVPALNVPHNMGWLWNIKPPGRLKPRRGWKPGALTKTMAAIIEKHRTALGLKPMATGPPPKMSKRKLRKNAYGVYETDSDPEVQPKSTLQIKKKDGCYLITMNPLKDPYTLEDNENPYMDCTPMQFKITKNKPPVQIKPGAEGGEDSCSCTCDENDETSSSNSELDIEFTPPAGIIHQDKLKKKKNVVHADTQYCLDDLPHQEVVQLEKKEKKEKKAGKEKGGKGGGKGKKGKKK